MAGAVQGMASAGSLGDMNRRFEPTYQPNAHVPQRGPGQFGNPIEQLMLLLHMMGMHKPPVQPMPPTRPPGGAMLSPDAMRMMGLLRMHSAPPDTGQMAGMPHYAYGGVAGMFGPEVAQLGERGPEAVVPLSGGQASPYGQPQVPQGFGGVFGGMARAQQQRQQTMNPTGPGFDPNNPFAGSYNRPLNTTEDIMGYLLRQNAQGGGFGAQGDPRITQMLRSQALQDATAQGRSARLGLLGRSSVDPSTFGYQSLMSDLNSQGQVANAMNQAQLQQALSAQDWYRNLFSGSAMGTQGFQNQGLLAAQQEAYAKDARKKNPLGQIAQIGGQLGAAALGG